MSRRDSSEYSSKILEIIRERRSIREFRDEEIPVEDLKLLIEAARWAPSGSNLQPWKFVIVTDKRLVKAIKLISPGMFGEPPALIIICHDLSRAELSRELQLIDIGASMQNILLYAHALGLGTCPIASFNSEGIAELLELPDHLKPTIIISVGKPERKPSPPERIPLDKLIVKIY
ncbi:MAG: nitroreductase family protein [Nitrososphaeria archaeon]|nr:nitroreductase family protein [Nitrososphaeria archaeon]MDW7986231.1 nitroreductase family protein [Nitrososphaerota archaeon]